jgi:hypothetical protein
MIDLKNNKILRYNKTFYISDNILKKMDKIKKYNNENNKSKISRGDIIEFAINDLFEKYFNEK